MAFERDIVGRDKETLAHPFCGGSGGISAGTRRVLRGLKTYMESRNIEIGLLVTPERLWLYHNRYLPSDNPIEEVGQFDVKNIFRFRGTGDVKEDEFEFERRVQYWLRRADGVQSLAAGPSNAAVQSYIVPVIAEAGSGATHPRVEFRVVDARCPR